MASDSHVFALCWSDPLLKYRFVCCSWPEHLLYGVILVIYLTRGCFIDVQTLRCGLKKLGAAEFFFFKPTSNHIYPNLLHELLSLRMSNTKLSLLSLSPPPFLLLFDPIFGILYWLSTSHFCSLSATKWEFSCYCSWFTTPTGQQDIIIISDILRNNWLNLSPLTFVRYTAQYFVHCLYLLYQGPDKMKEKIHGMFSNAS